MAGYNFCMAIFCTNCGTGAPDGATFCASCGKPIGAGTASVAGTATTASAPSSAGLSDNAAGAIAYVTIIPAIIFLLVEPYNRKRFVRFHAFQCLFLAAFV